MCLISWVSSEVRLEVLLKDKDRASRLHSLLGSNPPPNAGYENIPRG